MKNKILLLLIAISVLATGCGNKKTTNSNKNTKESNITQNNDVEEKPSSDKDESNPSDIEEGNSEKLIILTMTYSDDNQTINDYVSNLNKENNDNSFSVYDDTHYSLMVSESERQEVLEQYSSDEFIKESFKELFSDDQYNSAFIRMEHDELFKNITFYANKENYDNAGLSVIFGPQIISYAYSDIVQAYNLVPISERSCVIRIIDNETNDVIYDSSSDE